MSEVVTLRTEVPEDNEFRYTVYAASRREEMKSWGWSLAQEEAFCRMQFAAQQQGYRAQFPGMASSIVEQGGKAIGSLMVARLGAEIRLVDVALLPQFRGKGIGTKIIGDLIAEGERTGRPVRLAVVPDNRAIRLYRRLGLVATGADEGGFHLSMEKAAPAREADSPKTD